MNQRRCHTLGKMPALGMACPPQLWAYRTVLRRTRCKVVGVCGVVCWIAVVGRPGGLPATGTPLAQPARGSRTVTRNQLRRFLVRYTSLLARKTLCDQSPGWLQQLSFSLLRGPA